MDVQMQEVVRTDVKAIGSIAVGSVSAFLHPLVIMNISEHWNRLKAQEEGKPQPVFGALIGKQKGRNIEIMNSFELNYSIENGNVIIDKAFYLHKEEQFKQVFPDLDFLGWYTTGDQPDIKDINVHKQILEINESPVFLKLNPFEVQNKLPIKMYESITDQVNNEATVLFVEISYIILVTEEAERIKIINDYVKAMKNKELPMNQKTYVRVAASEKKEAIELPCENDSILLATVTSYFPGATGLVYRSESGAKRGLILSGGRFIAPEDGWDSRKFICIFSNETKKKSRFFNWGL